MTWLKFQWISDEPVTVFSPQLLNQLESSGAPPAAAEKIGALPVVSISQEQVGKFISCIPDKEIYDLHMG